MCTQVTAMCQNAHKAWVGRLADVPLWRGCDFDPLQETPQIVPPRHTVASFTPVIGTPIVIHSPWLALIGSHHRLVIAFYLQIEGMQGGYRCIDGHRVRS